MSEPRGSKTTADLATTSSEKDRHERILSFDFALHLDSGENPDLLLSPYYVRSHVL